jgi:hypothetical protein
MVWNRNGDHFLARVASICLFLNMPAKLGAYGHCWAAFWLLPGLHATLAVPLPEGAGARGRRRGLPIDPWSSARAMKRRSRPPRLPGGRRRACSPWLPVRPIGRPLNDTAAEEAVCAHVSDIRLLAAGFAREPVHGHHSIPGIGSLSRSKPPSRSRHRFPRPDFR